jgi:hypothetical protein
MNEQLRAIAQRIRAELPEMDRAIQRARQAFERASLSSDDLYLDSVALRIEVPQVYDVGGFIRRYPATI